MQGGFRFLLLSLSLSLSRVVVRASLVSVILLACVGSIAQESIADDNTQMLREGQQNAYGEKFGNSQQYWFKIRAANKYERSRIVDMGIAIDAISEDYVYAVGTEEDELLLKKYDVLEVSFPLTAAMSTPVDSGYRDYAHITETLKSLASQNPKVVALSSIGKSHEGRDIWSLRISGNLKNANNLPAVLYLGGHHAREHLSVEVPLKFAEKLLDLYNQGDQRIVGLIESRDIHIIPLVNPDGAEFDIEGGYYHMWRKNRTPQNKESFGVDLNRNYGYKWGASGASSRPSSDLFRGPAAFSESETTAIKNYIEAHMNISIVLSFHTYSELILYPWGHQFESIGNFRDQQVHETMAKQMATWNHYNPEQASSLYLVSGEMMDWTYGEHKLISFTFELDPSQNSGGGGFYPDSATIPGVVTKNWEPFLYLMEYADNPYRVLN